ncbi:MAG: hypothetical protein ACJ74Q_15090 [Pyrinomonadaceae bacterium]
MTKEATHTAATDPPAAQQDPLIGREYVCCRGPRKNSSVRVIRHIPQDPADCLEDVGDRFEVEGEIDGHRWTVSRAALNGIFGLSAKRRCNCFPLDARADDTVTTAAEAAPPREVAAVEPEPAAEDAAGESAPAQVQDPPPGEDSGALEAPSPEADAEEPPPAQHEPSGVSHTAAPPAAIFREDSAQGALF